MKRTNFLIGAFAGLSLAAAGCAVTPQYTIRPTPVPVETPEAQQIEREISRVQAEQFEELGARTLQQGQRVKGLDVVGIALQLARVTERSYLPYRVLMYRSEDPNAAALADGRIYISDGMLDYLAERGAKPDELAFILAHELGHTVAQHIVQRYQTLQRQQLLIGALAAGASSLSKDPVNAQKLGERVVNVGSLLQQVSLSGHSQQQELEADQLAVRYVMRAGFNPRSALDLFDDFQRFDNPSAILRTHPYSQTRREYVEQYLVDIQTDASPAIEGSSASQDALSVKIKNLRDAQKLYPRDSVSWKNLQKQIEDLERPR